MASLLGKHQIAANTTSLADGDSIASYLVSAAGTLLTHTTNGAKQALDVYGADIKAEDSAHSSGDLGSFVLGVRNDAGTAFGADGDYVPLSIDANGALRVNATVNFAGDYAEDSAHVSGDIGLFNLAVRRDTRSSGVDTDGDYASFNVNAVGELWVKDADSLAQLVLANASLDAIEADADEMNTSLNNIETSNASILSEIQALSHAEDAAHVSGDMGIQALAVRKDSQGSNAADGDYTSLLTWSEGSLKVVDIANGSILQQQVTVSSTAAQVPAANLANRKSLMLQNTSAAKIWIGSSTVTTSGATAGIELPANSFMELEVGPAVNVFAVKSGVGTLNLNLLELA